MARTGVSLVMYLDVKRDTALNYAPDECTKSTLKTLIRLEVL